MKSRSIYAPDENGIRRRVAVILAIWQDGRPGEYMIACKPSDTEQSIREWLDVSMVGKKFREIVEIRFEGHSARNLGSKPLVINLEEIRAAISFLESRT